MTLYDINSQIQQIIDNGISVDPETGEITSDLSDLESLQLAREEKIENTLLYIKNLVAESKAIKEEENALADRRKALENKASRIKLYIERMLNGESFQSAKVAVQYRNTTSVSLSDGFIEWAKENRPELLRVKEPEANKTAITKLLKAGETIEGAILEKNLSMTIK